MNKYKWFLIIFVTVFFITWQILYVSFGISIIPGAMEIIFLDLHTITDSVDSIRAGLNPYFDTSFDPLNRTFNYPKIWLTVFDTLGLNGGKTYYIGLFLVICFFASVIKLLKVNNLEQTFFGLLVLFSPPVLLITERGNSGIIIFLLVFSALSLISLKIRFRNYIYAGLVLVASILKLYPIFLLPSFFLLDMPKKHKTILALVTALIFITYFYLNIENYLLVFDNTPQADVMSYGRNVLIQKYLTGGKLHLFTGGLCLLLIGSSIFVIFTNKLKQNYIFTHLFENSSFFDKMFFIAGALIYTGTFMMGNNWDYRLVFLIFTIPLFLNHFSRFYTKFYLALLLVLFYFNFLARLGISIQIGISTSIYGLYLLTGWLVFFILTLCLSYELKKIIIQYSLKNAKS